ncbi:type II toxin-antitoxin system RelE/ParE family toxin [Sphingomonas endolithica]|uniref:type II toxin-antitoxin system RelE/ParE family toxin n=1 Tax=Sphingomonas endolithica TaxID=2972485 RepID=UPI0021AFBCB5|nr:type II toxin-antitoxin system RelE/ParE family toxin [Sphingomonas sp. ZFBP2030]
MPSARVAPSAQNDLRNIRIYSKSAFGAAAARGYLLGLRDAFAAITERPLIGTSEGDLGEGVRSFAYRSHRIYYRLDQAGVLVVRILHYARDVPRAMSTLRD